MNYYEENKNTYIKGFATFLKNEIDEELTTKEAKNIFKKYMYEYKNVVVDLRLNFWNSIIKESLKIINN